MRLGSLTDRLERITHHEQVVLSVLALVAGVAVAYAAVGFRLAIGGVQWLGFGFSTEDVFSRAMLLPWWQIMAVPVAGGLIVGLLLHFLMPNQRPQGVADVIEATALNNGRMRLRTALTAAVISVTSLGAGASTGREGPMVHLGAAIASGFSRYLRLSPAHARTLLGCGVASAVAASFNAPIAGVFFALEVVIGHYALSTFAPVVIASVAGTVVSRIHLGALPAFIIPEYAIVSLWEFPAFLLLGMVCALIAVIFMWSINFATDVVDRIEVPVWLKPVAGGLAVGAVAVYFPHILGVGYEATDAALKEQLPLWLLIALIVTKTAATATSLGCRFGGGVFSPSLFLGAMTGGAFGIIAAAAFPDLAAGHGAYAMVGMSALAAAVLGAPISTILIVFELTSDYRMTIAVMVATSVASVLVQQVMGGSFFHAQLRRRGLDLRGGRARHLLQALTVREVIAHDFETIDEAAPVGHIKRKLQAMPQVTFLVVNGGARLVGQLSFADLKEVAFDAGLDHLVNARDVVRGNPVVLTPDDPLEDALALMDVRGEDHLAVVDSPAHMHVVGIVHHKDVLRALNRALLQAQAEEHDEQRPG